MKTDIEYLTWDEKSELCRLANNMPETKDAFYLFTKEKYLKFDFQAWDMFITGVEINEDDFKNHIDLMKLIIPILDEEIKKGNHSFRTSYRMAITVEILNSL